MRFTPLLAAFLATAGACLAAGQQGPRLSERYEHKEHGYIVHYPADYEMQPGADDSTKIFASPADGDVDVFRENLAVMVRSYDREVPLEEARMALRLEMEKQGATAAQPPDKAKLAGREAYRFTWSLKLGGFDLALVQLVTTVRDRVYVLTYSFEVGREQRHRAAAQAMGDAFEITYK